MAENRIALEYDLFSTTCKSIKTLSGKASPFESGIFLRTDLTIAEFQFIKSDVNLKINFFVYVKIRNGIRLSTIFAILLLVEFAGIIVSNDVQRFIS